MKSLLKDLSARTGIAMSLIFVIGISLSNISCNRQGADSQTQNLRANPDNKRALGQFRAIPGTDYLIANIGSNGKGEYGSYGDGYGSSGYAYNFVFMDTKDHSVIRLLPTNDYLLIETARYPEADKDDKNARPAKWMTYSIVKSDTNNDQKLSREDWEVMAVSDVSGKDYKELLSGIEKYYGQTMKDEATLIVIYQKDKKKYLSSIDLVNKTVISTNEMPNLGEDVE
jgi:hypothetical protein